MCTYDVLILEKNRPKTSVRLTIGPKVYRTERTPVKAHTAVPYCKENNIKTIRHQQRVC